MGQSPDLPAGSRDQVERSELAALRALYERWARGDFNTPEIFHPQVVTVWDSRMPESRRDVGPQALGRTLRELIAEFDDFGFEAREFIEGPHAIAVIGVLHGTGSRSRAEVTGPFAHVWTFEEGLAVRLEGFFERAPALRAAGLDESAQ
jgi:ketosteroid isomerase-like protein